MAPYATRMHNTPLVAGSEPAYPVHAATGQAQHLPPGLPGYHPRSWPFCGRALATPILLFATSRYGVMAGRVGSPCGVLRAANVLLGG